MPSLQAGRVKYDGDYAHLEMLCPNLYLSVSPAGGRPLPEADGKKCRSE